MYGILIFVMNARKWIEKNAASLVGKVVAITGSTGGLGRELCRYVLSLGGSLLMLDRNQDKSLALKSRLLSEFQGAVIDNVKLDLSDMTNVKCACAELMGRQIDYLILNAGVYHVPLSTSALGYNNVFQVNFISPYCLVKGLLPALRRTGGKVVVVGSIAHKLAKLKENNIDYSTCKKQIKLYGNSKRFLTYSLFELLKNESGVGLSVCHPGVASTNMTTHYHKAVNWIVKPVVKLLFPSAKNAALSIVAALFWECGDGEWIGPKAFDIWGKPKLKKLRVDGSEREKIFAIAEDIYRKAIENNFDE